MGRLGFGLSLAGKPGSLAAGTLGAIALGALLAFQAGRSGGGVQVAVSEVCPWHAERPENLAASVSFPVVADNCLDEYTDHGHCGLLAPDGAVDNDATIERYAEIAVAQADAGADVVAPSGTRTYEIVAVKYV